MYHHHSLLFAISLIAPACGWAQNAADPYVEVQATDTVGLPLLSIEYSIQVKAMFDAGDIQVTDPSATQDLMTYAGSHSFNSQGQRAQLVKDLKEQKFAADTVAAEVTNYRVNMYVSDPPEGRVRVVLGSEQELKRLVAWLRQCKGASGRVVKYRYDESPASMAASNARAYHMAQDQAKQWASLSGRKLGRMISVHEAGVDDPFSRLVNTLSNIDDGSENPFSRALASSKTIVPTFVFRFALTD